MEESKTECVIADNNYWWYPQNNDELSSVQKSSISYDSSTHYGYCEADEIYDASTKQCTSGCNIAGCDSNFCHYNNFTCGQCLGGYTLYYQTICCKDALYFKAGSCVTSCGSGYKTEGTSHECISISDPSNTTNSTNTTDPSNTTNTTNTTDSSNTTDPSNTTNSTNTSDPSNPPDPSNTTDPSNVVEINRTDNSSNYTLNSTNETQPSNTTNTSSVIIIPTRKIMI